MFTILLTLAIAFTGGTFLFRNPGAGLVLAIFAWFIVGNFACTAIEKGDEEYAVRDTIDIQSAVTGSRIEGNFVLGSGTIEGERYYAYWTSEGTYRQGAVERRMLKEGSWDIEVVQTDSVDSKIIFTEYKKDETPWHIWIDHPYQRAEIFVPEGSIRYNYKLKAK